MIILNNARPSNNNISLDFDPEYVRNYAIIAHGNQKWANEKPYIEHLDAVYKFLSNYTTDVSILEAAYLHDIIEDTSRSYNDIKYRFTEEVADIVYAVTDELGRNRNERHEKTYPKIIANKKALLVKLADRYVNMAVCLVDGIMRDMYIKEYQQFKELLYTDDYTIIWQELDQVYSELIG